MAAARVVAARAAAALPAAVPAGLLLSALVAGPSHAQDAALVDRTALADVVLLSELAQAPPTAGAAWEAATVAHLSSLLRGDTVPTDPPMPGVLEPSASALIARGNGFQRDIVAALGEPDPTAAVSRVVAEYRMQREGTYPAAPKNMDVLYDHDAALAFRSRFPELSGLRWAGEWARLAVTEPMTDLPDGPEREAGLDTVEARYLAKLTPGEPPDAPPSELPLAPAIAPGLLWVSPEAAMIWDNHSMFVEVVADILTSADVGDRAEAIDAAAAFFADPTLGVTAQLTWETMALRHGIFFQGGFPLAVMTESERNAHGHGAHQRSGSPMVIPGMIGR